jgi:hypothetical protein
MFGWLDWGKFKREWKTAALTVAWAIVELYDLIAPYVDLPQLFPRTWQPFIRPAIPILILLLRRWKDANA